MRVRPCIDIHNGRVKQIVGGSLHSSAGSPSDEHRHAPENASPTKKNSAGQAPVSTAQENYVSPHDAAYYAAIYRERNLPGGHIILLNSKAAEPKMYEADRQLALAALREWPGGMQVGGGITPENAAEFLDAGASHVIVTSYVFRNGELDQDRLGRMEQAVGKERLVLDLSCRRWDEESVDATRPENRSPEIIRPLGENRPLNERVLQSTGDNAGRTKEAARHVYRVVTDRWQKWTDLEVNEEALDLLSAHCDEFLIHAADVEGRQQGVETELVRILGRWLEKKSASEDGPASVCRDNVHPGRRNSENQRFADRAAEQGKKPSFPVTYAGGVHALSDINVLRDASGGRLDFTIGSALDLFGGSLRLDEVEAYILHGMSH